MKNLLYPVLFIVLNTFIGYSQIISINDESFPESKQSLEELITNVLILRNCSDVYNFEPKVFGEPEDFETKSYGYFKRPQGSDFPFEEGVILTTGRAFPAGNAIIDIDDILDNYNGNQIINDDDGDGDLEEALAQTMTQDATFIKFNFTSQVESISFRFLMASEEYDGYFECYFADSFAFLLREVGTQIYTNFAVLPDGIPVSVTNINYSSLIPNDPELPADIDCDSHIEYFEGYNVGHTNYDGRTVALTATSAVTSGVTYEIKLVVADQGDSRYDSAIFLEGGSFNIAGDLGEDRKISTNNPGCLGSPIELDTNISLVGTTYNWYKNGVEIDGEIDSTLSVITDGTYSFEATLDSGCLSSDEIIIEFAIPPKIVTAPKDILLCDSDGNLIEEFDFSGNEVLILGTQLANSFHISYHKDEAAAEANSEPLTNPYENTLVQETIWVRIADTTQTCFLVTSFDIEVNYFPTANTPKYFEICDTSDDGDHTNEIATFDLSTKMSEVYKLQSTTDYDVKFYYNQSAADKAINGTEILVPIQNSTNPQTIFARIENKSKVDCYSTTSFKLIVNPLPEIDLPLEHVICLNKNDVAIDPENTPFLKTPPIETGLNNTEYSFQWYSGTINDVNSDSDSVLILGERDFYYSPLSAGVYTVLATNKLSGCRVSASTTVVESYPPETISSELLSFTFAENNIIEVSVEGKGTYEYRIDYGSWQTGTRFENISIGEHRLFVRDLYNCNSLTEKKIVIGFNKFFTPNGDEYNDTWNIIGFEAKNNVKIYIFDRYGKLLKLINSSEIGWDGTYRGALMPTGDYWFQLNFLEPKTNIIKQFSSHFTLKR